MNGLKTYSKVPLSCMKYKMSNENQQYARFKNTKFRKPNNNWISKDIIEHTFIDLPTN